MPAATSTILTMADDLKPPQAGGRQALLLQVWLSPSFPVGAFAYSHGLERAAETGLIKDRASLAAWIADLLAHGSIRNDLIVLAAAWRAASRDDERELAEITELAAALHPSAERRLESVTQGRAFLDAIAAAWPPSPLTLALSPQGRGGDRSESPPPASPLPGGERGRVRGPTPHALEMAYPVAVAIAAANHGIALAPLLEAYATAFTGNLTSAAIRLSVIGQTDAQRILAELLPAITAAAGLAEASTLDDLGSATWAADLCSMEHETQYTRLFRS